MEEVSENNYEASKKAMVTLVEKSAKKGGKAIKAVASQINKQEKPELEAKCALARRVFEEALDMYKDGDMDFAEMIEDISRSLKAIEK